MTIVISMKVPDGLALAADSITALYGASSEEDGASSEEEVRVVQTYEHGEKLARLGKTLIGTLTYGIGGIGNRTIGSLISEFVTERFDSGLPNEENYKVSDIAQNLCDFFHERYEDSYEDEENQPVLGFIISGYSAGSFFPEDYGFQLPRETEISRIRPDRDGSPIFGVAWRGFTEPVERFVKGISTHAWDALNENTSLDVTEELITEISNQSGYSIPYGSMPLQDAVDYVNLLANIAKGVSRFIPEAPPVGGKIELATITYEEFDWIVRKSLTAKREKF